MKSFQKLVFNLILIVTISLVSCKKSTTQSEEFSWEVDITIDGERQHWKGTETYPNAPADNWCLIDYQSGSWTLLVSNLKTVDADDWISGSDEFTMSLTWAQMNGTEISGALFLGGTLSYSGKSYLFGQDLQCSILSDGTSPDLNSDKWGSPFEVSIPNQNVVDANGGSSHTISGSISALRLY